jgi:hypothetical protein
MPTVFDKHEGIKTAKGSVFSVLQGHVQGLDGKDYYEEIDGELVSQRLADVLIEKGILEKKGKPAQPKETKSKKKDK